MNNKKCENEKCEQQAIGGAMGICWQCAYDIYGQLSTGQDSYPQSYPQARAFEQIFECNNQVTEALYVPQNVIPLVYNGIINER